MITPKYIQIVNCGKLGFALWDFPHSSTFYPIHGLEEECEEWAIKNNYEPISENNKRMIWKLSPNSTNI